MFLLESLLLIDKTASHDQHAETTSIPYLLWMCHEIINHKQWSEDKAHRWVGYIQGVMVAKGWSTVAVEGERVRKVESKTIPGRFQSRCQDSEVCEPGAVGFQCL